MAKIIIERATLNLIDAHSATPGPIADATPRDDGRYEIELSNATMARLKAHALPGEAIDDTLLRLIADVSPRSRMN